MRVSNRRASACPQPFQLQNYRIVRPLVAAARLVNPMVGARVSPGSE
jgi:hypothetical protein